jgi:hypothetical protein
MGGLDGCVLNAEAFGVSAPARRPVAALAARLRPGLGAAATGNVRHYADSLIHPVRLPKSARHSGGIPGEGCRSSRPGQPPQQG